LLAQEEVSGLVHDALARVVGAHVSQPAGPIPDLLCQLALGGLLDRLPGVDSASGHLPRRPARHVPILSDQEDGVRIEEREDAHALSAGYDTVDRGASVGQLHEVLPKGEPAILVYGPRGCRLPGNLREPSHPCRSRKNARVCRGESPSDAASAIRSRARSSGVSMSYYGGRHATRSPPVALVQELAEAVREPVAEIRAPLRDEDEAWRDLLEKGPGLHGRVGDCRAGRPERPHLVDLVEKEAAVELRCVREGERRTEPRFDLARAGRLGHDHDGDRRYQHSNG